MAIKTNELPGTRAVLRHSHMSSTKAREVLDLIRGLDYVSAAERLEYTERAAGVPIAKLLRSCAANAEHNEGLDPTELYVATCYADEGETMKRWRPRARGRATRIRKRTCHVTIILARMPDEQLARRRARVAAGLAERRARRVAGTRRRQAEDEATQVAEESEALETTASEALEEIGGETDAVEVDAGETEAEAVGEDEVSDDAVVEAETESAEGETPAEDVAGDAAATGEEES
jgi:large subunit ribosomal protein L22